MSKTIDILFKVGFETLCVMDDIIQILERQVTDLHLFINKIVKTGLRKGKRMINSILSKKNRLGIFYDLKCVLRIFLN